ncbi:class I adenylate-forming enzyme family protein [Streptomyces albipurpureus]|uniref:Acyl--CoA ligase n=1 Tax=Streptomyces albipurpureus TaxID=2897419 RepID=A0ABT0UZ51_9ACTN|nr:class I adenylate-forming enzyme family protein [Streptomyces sp. CWNU-1]MCM2393380.1 acyl--CoA ligase [Streptomyces sp. CWNU-1]
MLTAPGAPFAVARGEDGGLFYVDGPRTLVEFVEVTWGFGDQVFLVGERSSYSYREFLAAACALARRFTEGYGLRPGDRAAMVMRNCPEWQIAFWAAQLAGLVAVPLNARWTVAELEYVLDDCQPRVLLVDGERLALVDDWRRRAGARVITFEHEGVAEGGERYEDFPAVDPRSAPPQVEVRAEDDATIFYTSGTTGRPKGAVATHLAQAGAAQHPRYHAAAAALGSGRFPGQGAAPVALMTYPFFHVAALTALYSTMSVGGTLVLMRRWDADDALALIARHRVTHFSGVPTTALDLLDAAERTGDDLATLTHFSTGGAAAPPALVTRLAARYGHRIEPRTGYGLTETSGGVLAVSGDEYRNEPAGAGAPAPAVEVRIVGVDAEPVPEGEPGELWLRGQSLIRGYWRDEAATAAAFEGGWFKTGDLATVRDGRVAIVDRIKDIVLRGGETVYCAQVEAALHDLPAVADAAVFGVPHDRLGEEVAAVVRLRPGAAVTMGELTEQLADRIAAYQVPTLLSVGDIPRNAAGKTLRGVLRSRAQGLRNG